MRKPNVTRVRGVGDELEGHFEPAPEAPRRPPAILDQYGFRTLVIADSEDLVSAKHHFVLLWHRHQSRIRGLL